MTYLATHLPVWMSDDKRNIRARYGQRACIQTSTDTSTDNERWIEAAIHQMTRNSQDKHHGEADSKCESSPDKMTNCSIISLANPERHVHSVKQTIFNSKMGEFRQISNMLDWEFIRVRWEFIRYTFFPGSKTPAAALCCRLAWLRSSKRLFLDFSIYCIFCLCFNLTDHWSGPPAFFF